MFFKRFSLHRKKHELCIFVNRKWLQAISSVKTKICKTLFLNILALVISFLLRNSLIQKVWVDLINKRQHKTQGFLGKITESH